MDKTSSLAGFPSHLALAETPPNNSDEDDSQSEAGDIYKYCNFNMCWDGIFSSLSSEDSGRELEHQMDFGFSDSYPIFDFHGIKARRASRYAVERSHTALARRQRTTKRDVSRANRSQEPIGSRNDVWKEALEKGAFATYVRRRCRCEYCMQRATLSQERRTLQWAVRRAEQGKDWGRERDTTNKKPQWPQWADYDWDVEYEDGYDGESWDREECVLGLGKVPPMEANLSDLVRIRRPRSRKAEQSRLFPYSGLAHRGTKNTSSMSESDHYIELASPISGSGPLLCNDDWEVLSLYSEWDGYSVRASNLLQ